jgi:hypothetical protein
MPTLKVVITSKDIQLVAFSAPEGTFVVVAAGSCEEGEEADVGILGNGGIGVEDMDAALEDVVVVVEVVLASVAPTKKKDPAIGSPRDVLVAKSEMRKPCLLMSVPFVPLKNVDAVVLKSLGCL